MPTAPRPTLLALVIALLGALTFSAQATAAQATAAQAATDTSNQPKVLVIATGGTIAGVQAAPGTLGEYRAGTLSAEQIIASVPELSRHARVETEQFSNVASGFITPQQWLSLSRRINELLASRSDLAGVVVTHGTDRLEETAFFLYLTVRSEKPVVVVGAQRPATGISPDGPMNLLAAVRTVVSPQALGKGVLVVMDERILSAREARKQYQRVGGFDGGDMGMLGVVGNGGPEFFFAPVRRRGPRSEFEVASIDSLPRVEMVMTYPGGSGSRFDTLPAGVVLTSTSLTRAEARAYRQLRMQGVIVAAAFPSGDNVAAGRITAPSVADSTATPVTAEDSLRAAERAAERAAPPMIGVQHLTPQKVRILLMLALTRTRDPVEIQRIFREY